MTTQPPEPLSAKDFIRAILQAGWKGGSYHTDKMIPVIEEYNSTLLAPHLAKIKRLEEALIKITNEPGYCTGSERTIARRALFDTADGYAQPNQSGDK